MPKIEIAKVNTPLNSHEFQAQINRNFEKVSEALDNQLQRTAQEGVVNYMEQELDMRGNRIINLAKAVDPTDAMRKQEFDDITANVEQWAKEAKDSAASAAEDEALAEEHRRVAVSAAQSAQEHERQTQELFDTLMSDDSIPVVAENIEDVKEVADNMESVKLNASKLNEIEAVFDIAKRIAYGNIGDIRATFAATAPEGCRFTDGTEIKKEDYPELFEMLEKGEMPYDSLTTWTNNINSKGITGAFGYVKGADTARLPLLTEAFVEATNITPSKINDAGLPNITGKFGYVSNYNGEAFFEGSALYKESTSNRRGWDSHSTEDYNVIGFDASRSNEIYGTSETVQPKSIMLRHYIVLTNSRQMILTMRTSVTKKSDLPTTGNINGDIRVVTNEGVAYVWARSSATTWMWSSIGRVGTNGAGAVEWVDIQGDLNQNKDLKQALDKKIGNNSTDPTAVAIGLGASADAVQGIAIGRDAKALFTTATSIGARAKTEGVRAVAIGQDAYGAPYGISIGGYTAAENGAIAIGESSFATADRAIQLGAGHNPEADSLYVGFNQVLRYPAKPSSQNYIVSEYSVERNYKLLDGLTGKIPVERLPEDLGGGFKTLDAAQKAQLLRDGTYEGSEVVDKEVFTETEGKFVEFSKMLNPGDTWQTKDFNSTVFSSKYNSVVKGSDGVYYAVSTSLGYLKTSVDGVNWTEKKEAANVKGTGLVELNGFLYAYTSSGGGKHFLRINKETGEVTNITDAWYTDVAPVYGNGVYVAGGVSGLFYSTDGVSFSQAASATYARVCFDGSRFVAFSRMKDASIRVSTDGVSWETVGSFSDYAIDVKFFKGKYVVLSSNKVYYSTDLLSWSSVSSVGSYSTSDGHLVKSGEHLCAYETAKTTAYVSSDVETWNAITLPYAGMVCGVDGGFWILSQTQKHSLALTPFYEYSLASLSYTKEEVDAVIAEEGYFKNLTTQSNSVTIVGNAATGTQATNIGFGTTATGQGATSVGYSAKSTTGSVAVGISSNASVQGAVAIGPSAVASASRSIQIGRGTNSEANSVYMSTSQTNNWKMLGSDGLIPAERTSLQGTTAPDTATVGSIGRVYVDTATGTGYMCVGVSGSTYTWKQITA